MPCGPQVTALPKGGQTQLSLTRAAAEAVSAGAAAAAAVSAAEARAAAVSAAALRSSGRAAAVAGPGLSMKAALAETHKALQEFLAPPAQSESGGGGGGGGNGEGGGNGGGGGGAAVLYLDSTNGSIEARRLYSELSRAGRTIEVALRPGGGGGGGEEAAVLGWLLARTSGRLGCGGGVDEHPGFPATEDEQASKHRRIISGLEWPGSAVHAEGRAEAAAGGHGGTALRRQHLSEHVLIEADVMDVGEWDRFGAASDHTPLQRFRSRFAASQRVHPRQP